MVLASVAVLTCLTGYGKDTNKKNALLGFRGLMLQRCPSIVTRQLHVPGIQQEPAPFRQQEEA